MYPWAFVYMISRNPLPWIDMVLVTGMALTMHCRNHHVVNVTEPVSKDQERYGEVPRHNNELKLHANESGNQLFFPRKHSPRRRFLPTMMSRGPDCTKRFLWRGFRRGLVLVLVIRIFFWFSMDI